MRKLCVIPYYGGKQSLLKHLIPLIPPHDIYVEVFGGAASLLLNKPPCRTEVYNDIDGDLANLFMMIRDHPRKLQKKCASLPYSRGIFNKFYSEISEGKAPKDPVERAARFFYVMQACFSGKFGGSWGYGKVNGGRGRGPSRYQNAVARLTEIADRLKKAFIDSLDFRQCIKNWDTPETLFYLDPPYIVGGGGYRYKFSEQDHLDLAEILSKIKGKWLLTYDDHPWVRETYRDYIQIRNTATKLASNVKNRRRSTFKQLIITNYPLPAVKRPLKAYKPEKRWLELF